MRSLLRPLTNRRWSLPDLSVVHTVGASVALGLLVGFVLVALTNPVGILTGASADSSDSPPPPAGPVTFDIQLGDLYIEPSAIDVPAGAELILNVTNVGALEHDLALEGNDPTPVAAGEVVTIRWGGLHASTQAWCTVAGHREAGMVLDINVIGADQAVSGQSAASDHGGVDFAEIDPNAAPAADWQPYDATVKPAPGGDHHELTLVVTEGTIEVAPGVEQELWMFGGTVPGPVLRGKVGDLFTITLVNEGSIQHSIDFHASKVAPNVEMRPIDPGESLVYQFKAEYAGAFSYHCGVAPMIHHMGNGMFGAVIIDPPDLPEVDKEFILIQSELNLGPQGEPMNLTKMMTGENDAVVFNGYYNQYVHRPLHVEPTDRVRIWVVNLAVNEDLSFHVVGTIFDTVWREGAYVLERDNPHRGGAQALDLGSTQGGFVEFTLETPGQYTFVAHEMRNLSRGAAGVIISGDGGQGSGH